MTRFLKLEPQAPTQPSNGGPVYTIFSLLGHRILDGNVIFAGEPHYSSFFIVFNFIYLQIISKHFGDSSTTTLWRHLEKNHVEIIAKQKSDICKLSQKREQVSFFILNNNYIVVSILTRSIKFTEEEFRKKLLHWIVVDDQPLIVTERPEFQDLISYLRAGTTPPTADTIRRDLKTNFTLTKEHVRKELQVSSRRSIFMALKVKLNKFYFF
jgi:hypothetical protein